jgi:hypothetical protein
MIMLLENYNTFNKGEPLNCPVLFRDCKMRKIIIDKRKKVNKMENKQINITLSQEECVEIYVDLERFMKKGKLITEATKNLFERLTYITQEYDSKIKSMDEL